MTSIELAPKAGAPGDVTPGAALDVFCRAARQVALYTLSHPAALAALEDATRAFEPALANKTRATLSVGRKTLLWDGEALSDRSPSVKELHERLHRRVMAKVVFHAGIQREDLAALLDILTQDPEELDAAGGAVKVMEAHDVQHVNIAEVDYSKYLRESEMQWLETISGETRVGGSAIEHLVGVCLVSAGVQGQDEDDETTIRVGSRPTLVDFGLPFAPPGSLETTPQTEEADDATANEPLDISPEDYLAMSLANVIQRSGELVDGKPGAVLSEWRAQVARAVRRLSPPLRARLFRAPVLTAEGAPDFLAEVAKPFSSAEIVSIILGHPEAVVKEPSPQLALLLGRLVPDQERRSEVEPILHSTLLNQGMTEDSYRNVIGLLLDHVSGASSEAAQMLEKQLGVLAVKPEGSEQREGIADLLATLEHNNVVDSRLLMLEELVDMDHEPAQFVDLTRYLEQDAVSFAGAGDTERLVRVVHSLERQVQPESPRADSYRVVAARALRRTGTEPVVSRLKQALAGATPEQKCGVVRLLGHLGDRAAPILVDAIRGEPSLEVEQAAVLALARMGGEGDRAVQNLLSDRDTDLVTKAMRILARTNEDAMIKHLYSILDRPDWRLKAELVHLLAPCQGPQAEHILVRALLDDSIKVRAQAADSLGTRRATSAVGALSLAAERGALHGEGFHFRKAAVSALGRIASAEAVASLGRVLSKGSRLFRENSDSLRSLAAQALARIPAIEAYEALTQGQAERRPQVRDACRAATEEWKMNFSSRSDLKGAHSA